MLILTIKTDNPIAEIGLFDNETKLAYEAWEAHRKLAETIHTKIDILLSSKNKTLKDLGGIIVYKGPGSFTGLRIGMSVANALSYGLSIPVIGSAGKWIPQGISSLVAGKTDKVALPEYGAPVHVTKPKK